MPIAYMQDGAELKPYVLGPADLRAIGRLVRACAEIDDCLTAYLCHVARINEGQALILLGKMPISGKKRMACTFAESHGPDELARFNSLFGTPEYSEIMKCRNSVAHGILLGRTPDGHIAFRVPDMLPSEGDTATVQVNAYSASGLASYAHDAAALAESLRSFLNQQGTQERRRERGLRHHPKGQTKRQTSKPKRPPPASQV